jgi:hypothetical protein
MSCSFDQALSIAREKYPHPINHYQEYSDNYVFDNVDGAVHVGGTKTLS